jgi:formamidopyrimidine-DNA glycosylase
VPELPEVQALAERLDAALAGATFTGAVPHQFSALKTVVPSPATLVGLEMKRVDRRGKYVAFEFASGERLLVHLSQGGRVDL